MGTNQLQLFSPDDLKRLGAESLKRTLPKTEHRHIDIAQNALLDDGTDISFLHRGFAQVGLPLRAQPDGELWVRSDGLFTLTVDGKRFAYSPTAEVSIGIPYGPKARLLMVFISSEVMDGRRDAHDPFVELGRITEWLRGVGISPSGGAKGSITAVKEQLFRLAFAQFSMVRRQPQEGKDDQVWFQSEMLFQGGIFRESDFETWAAGHYAKLTWPKALMLTQNSLTRIRNQSIPVSTVRLREIADSAAAMDLFFWLSYRLPRIPQGEKVLVSWRDLMNQFGQQAAFVSDFQKAVKPALKSALAAYPEANVDIGPKGIVLKYSDPAVPPRPRLVQGASIGKK